MTIPERTISPEVLQAIPVRKVVESYLATELGNSPFAEGDYQMRLAQAATLSETELWNWLKALSFTIRLNGLFWLMSSEGNSWYETTLPADQITVTGIKPHIDRILARPEISHNAVRFAEYIRAYFLLHPDTNDDPEQLNEFRPRGEIENPVLILTKKDNKHSLVDGAHRLVVLLLNGHSQIKGYVGEKTKSGQLPRSGSSAFFELLRTYYHSKTETEKAAVLTTLMVLLRISADAQEGLERIWINGQPPEIAAAATEVFTAFKQQQ